VLGRDSVDSVELGQTRVGQDQESLQVLLSFSALEELRVQHLVLLDLVVVPVLEIPDLLFQDILPVYNFLALLPDYFPLKIRKQGLTIYWKFSFSSACCILANWLSFKISSGL